MSLRSRLQGAMPRYLFAVLLLLAASVLVMAPGGSSAAPLATRAASVSWQGAVSSIADRFSLLEPPAFGPNVRANRDTTAFGQHEPSLAVSRVNTNTVFAAAKDYRDGNIKRVWIYGSTDGGTTWPVQLHMPGLPSTQTESDPVVVARDDGRIYVSCLTTGNEGIWITWTDDAGQTWQPSVPLVQNQSSLQDKEWFAIDNNPSSPYYHRMYMMYAPGAAYVVEQHSTDGGLTWSAQQQIGASGTEYTYPVVASDGTVYNFMMLNWGPNRLGTVQMTKSSNGGATWSTPATVTTAQQPASPIRSQDQFRFFAIISAAVDPNSVGPNHVLYVAWTDNRNFSTNGTDVVYVKSTNGGTSWGPVTRLSHDPTGVVRDHITPMMVVGADSKVHAFWLDRRLDPNNRMFDSWYSSSTNGGATWDPDTRVSTVSQDLNIGFPPGSGNAAGDYWGLDTWRDTVYVAWNDTRSGHQDILVSKGLMNSAITATPTLIPTSTPTATPTATSTTGMITATPTCEPGFHVVTSPNVAGMHNQLADVAVVSADDIWAVGNSYTNTGEQRSSTLIMRWNGSQWSIVPSPNIADTSNYLYGVTAISSNDVWAVGTAGGFGTPALPQTLTMRWNGSQWSIVPSPNPGEGRNTLFDVAAASANDVWAVGVSSNAGSGRTLTMRWNGSQWSIVPSPSPAAYDNVLKAVAVVSPSDVWTVGYQDVSSGGFRYTLIEHWDGSQWSVVSSPNPSAYAYTSLQDLAVISASEIWSVGGTQLGSVQSPYIVRWNGSQWSSVNSPRPPNSGTQHLSGVTAISPTDVWAVGEFFSTSTSRIEILLEHWNGSQWSIVSAPNPGTYDSSLRKIATLPGNDAIAVGLYRMAGGFFQTLVERYISSCQTATPTMVVTATHTAAATSTLPATSTPTRTLTRTPLPSATSTPCALTFTDVPSNHTFYASVRCLACRGIVSGYADGTFRPDNLVTRSQLAKIVSNAGNFQEDPGPQIFEDVPLSNPFYEWINRLTLRGHMSGYTCGSTGEPCRNGNRPYFRPFADATRAQTSKIVANAARYNDPPTGQTFEDVPPSHPFYEWIQRLASRNIMVGYQCGGPGEPCGSGNRAYFRPYNNVTRGQSAKIVANTFFPVCGAP